MSAARSVVEVPHVELPAEPAGAPAVAANQPSTPRRSRYQRPPVYSVRFVLDRVGADPEAGEKVIRSVLRALYLEHSSRAASLTPPTAAA